MERGDPNVYNYINNVRDLYTLLFQIIHGLYVAQEVYKFTHYDLHLENIVVVPTEGEYSYYQYHYKHRGSNITRYFPRPKFLVKIIDFGLSRLETNNIILNYKHDGYPIRTYGLFDPVYDLALFFGPYLYNLNNPLGQKILTILSDVHIYAILSSILGVFKTRNESFDKYRKRVYANYYSGLLPITSRLRNAPKLEHLLDWLANALALPNIVAGTIFEYQIIQKDRLISPLTRVLPGESIPHIIDSGIIYEKIVRSYPIEKYNLALPDKSMQQKQSTVNIVSIDPYIASKYKFKTLCCKLEPMEYLNDKIGVAINGTFFDIHGTYIPIGPYREYLPKHDKYYETNIELNKLYEQYFGFITIENGKINIHKVGTVDVRKIKDAFMGGPLLVWNGEPQIDTDTLKSEVNIDGSKIKIFQCKIPENDTKNKLLKLNNHFVFNCNTIGTGEI